MSYFVKSPSATLLDIIAKGGLGYTTTKIPITYGSRPRRSVQEILMPLGKIRRIRRRRKSRKNYRRKRRR